MKRPSKKPQRIKIKTNILNDLIHCYSSINNLEQFIKDIKKEGAFEITIENDEYHDSDYNLYYFRLETSEEASKRYENDLKKYKKFKEQQKSQNLKRREQVIKEAKKLGISADDLK